MKQTIFPTTRADIAQMIEICAQNLVENNRDKFAADDFAAKGFLIRKLTREDVEEMLADQENHFSCVVKNGAEILGYLTGCDVKKSEIDFIRNVPELAKFKNQKLFYHKQIVKKLDAKNVGTKLLQAMFDEAKIRNYSHVVCRIVHKPFFNQASIFFIKNLASEKLV